MRRREFIRVAIAAVAWPLTAHAQQAGKMYRVGVLNPGQCTRNPKRTACQFGSSIHQSAVGIPILVSCATDALSAGKRCSPFTPVARIKETKQYQRHLPNGQDKSFLQIWNRTASKAPEWNENHRKITGDVLRAFRSAPLPWTRSLDGSQSLGADRRDRS